MTPREQHIARLYSLGFQATEIARQLGISTRTVYCHAYRARRKNGAVPKLALGAPARRVDYFTYANDFRAGLTVTAIAAKHGVWPSTVSRALRILRDAGATLAAPQVGGDRRSGASA